MRHLSIALTGAALIWLTTTAQAQQSLFDQKPADPAAAAGAPAEAAKPKPKPKLRGPQPARALTVVNAGTGTVAKVEVTGETKTVTWSKPISAKAKAIVKLPPQKACTVTVTATVEGEAPGAPGEVDICKDKQVRLTD